MSPTDLEITRRELVAQVGLLATLAAAGTPTLSAEMSPIERAFWEYKRLAHLSEAAEETFDEAEQRFEEPERPGWHPLHSAGGYKLVKTTPGKCRVYADDSAENLAELRTIIASPESHEALVARAKATLAKIETWQTIRQRRSDDAGLTEALEARNASARAEKAQAATLHAMTPTCLRDLAFQAATLRIDWDEEAVNELVIRVMKLAQIDPWDEFSNEEAA